MSYLLAVDAGTSSTRSALRDTQGRLLSEASSAYQIARPNTAWAEMAAGHASRSAVSELGLVEGIPVIAGGLDAAVEALGAGVVRLGQAVGRVDSPGVVGKYQLM